MQAHSAAVSGLVAALQYGSVFAIVLFRDTLSGFFTPNAAVIQSAGVRILCMLLFEPLCNLYEIPVGVLRGSGHALYPALSTMVGRCAFRIAWIYTVFRAIPTLPMLYHAFPLSWAATIVLTALGLLALRPLCPAASIRIQRRSLAAFDLRRRSCEKKKNGSAETAADPFLCPYFFFALFQLRNSITTNGIPR